MRKIEKIEVIYSQGTAETREDGLIVNPPFFGVIDGTSAPHHYKMTPVLFNSMTGGEMVRKVILETFYLAEPKLPLRELILQANRKIGKIQTERGISIDRSDLLAAASFVFAKIGEKNIEIIQGGDCFGVWLTNSGEIGITKTSYQKISLELMTIINDLSKKHNGDRKEMLVEFAPLLAKFRRRYINTKTYDCVALLNGQPWVEQCWQRLEVPLENLDLLLLFSDGFMLTNEIISNEEIAKKAIKAYTEKGFTGTLRDNRLIEKSKETQLHITHQEATAIAIKFEKIALSNY